MPIGLGTAITQDQCVSYQCGADPTNMAARFQCAQAGYSGVKSCNDPACAAWCPKPAANDANAPVAAVPQPNPVNPPRPVVRFTCDQGQAGSGVYSAGDYSARAGVAGVIDQLKSVPVWAWLVGGVGVLAWKGRL